MALNLVAPCNCFLGYGHVGWNILYHFYLMDRNSVNFFPIGQPAITNGQAANDCISYTINKDFNNNIPTLVVWHEFDLFTKALGKGAKFSLSFFEIDSLDKHRVKNLKSMDMNIQPSEWGKLVLKNHKIDNVTTIPCGFSPEIFKPKKIEKKSPTYRFFNIGKMEYRKGHDIICKAFNNIFLQNDDVELHMFWDNMFLNQQEKDVWVSQYKNSKLADKIFFHSYKKTDQEFADFISSMDCGIFPTRAEGFGLPILQSIACGKPVITTNYSGQTEYCNADNSFLLNITEFEDCRDGKFFTEKTVPPNARWAKLTKQNEQELMDYMLFAYKNKYNKDSSNTVQHLTWENIICKLDQLF